MGGARKPIGKKPMPMFGEIKGIKSRGLPVQGKAMVPKYVSTKEALEIMAGKSNKRMPAFGEIRVGKGGPAQAEKYGANEKNWRNPGRAGNRIFGVTIGGFVGQREGQRIAYLDRAIGEKFTVQIMENGRVAGKKFSKELLRKALKNHKTDGIRIPKEFELVPVGMAMRRAFASIELPDKRKRMAVAKIIGELHNEGKVSIDGETMAVFTEKAKDEIGGQLGQKSGEFMENFRCFLQDETNWTRDYLHKKLERVVSEPWT